MVEPVSEAAAAVVAAAGEWGLQLFYWFGVQRVAMSEKKQPVDLGLLEEDDEFEEFPAEGNPLGCAGSRRLGHADRDSGLRGGGGAGARARREGARREGARGKPGPPRPALGALPARPSVRPAWGSECHGETRR